MANGTTSNRRNIVIGIVAAIVVLLVILWLAGVFQTPIEEPLSQDSQTESTSPEQE